MNFRTTPSLRSIVIIWAIAIVLFALNACTARIDKTDQEIEIVKQKYLISGNRITVFVLKDGTRCVFISAGGIDCDWLSDANKVEK